MKLYVIATFIFLFVSQFILAQLQQQEKIVISSFSIPSDKLLADKLVRLREQVNGLTPELEKGDWNNLLYNISRENFDTLCRILKKYETELNSLPSETDTLLIACLQDKYRYVWNLISKYATDEKYRDEIKKRWVAAIQNKSVMPIELLLVNYKEFATAEDISQLKNNSWEIIEKIPDIYLFDTFCRYLMYPNPVTKKSLGDAGDIERLHTMIRRIDTSSPAGKRAMEVASYSCGIMRYNTDSTYGITSRILTPLTFEQLLELGQMEYFSDAELAERDKEKADAKTAFEAKLKKASELITTENGRLEMVRIINSENEVQQVKTTYFTALHQYYLDTHNKDIHNGQPVATVWRKEFSTPAENEALGKLLQSSDIAVKEFALQLIERANARSLVPEILKICAEKEQIPNMQSSPFSPDPNFKPRIYHFLVYRLLGKLGNERTLQALEKLQVSDKITNEVKEDVTLAIEDIKKNFAEQERLKKERLEMRKLIREGKLGVIGHKDDPLMKDIDKPDPEPVSPDGFRKWETTDRLFKTTAKFVSLNKGNVTLEKEDSKQAIIELKALRKIDHEYIRQQLEPLRDWSTADGSIKINAKLLGKFDKEIILEESDGFTTTIQTEKLSTADKEYLKHVPVSPHSKYVF